MNANAFARFILKEDITSKGKPLGEDDEKDKDKVPEFGTDEDDPTDPLPGEDDKTTKSDPEPEPSPSPEPTPEPAAGGEEPKADDNTPDPGQDPEPEPEPAAPDNPAPEQNPEPEPSPEPTPEPAAGGETPPDDGGSATDDGDEDVPEFGSEEDDPTEQPEPEPGQEAQPGGDGEMDMPAPDIKQLEDDIFAALTPEQIEMKKTELKSQFAKLYEAIDKTIERLSKVDRTSQSISEINFVTKKLLDLRDLLKESLVDNFSSKTYVENQIILQRHMVIYAALTNVVENIGKKRKEEESSKKSSKSSKESKK